MTNQAGQGRKRRHEAGLGLVEVLIAASLFLLLMTGMAATMMTGTVQVTRGRLSTALTEVTNRRFAALRAQITPRGAEDSDQEASAQVFDLWVDQKDPLDGRVSPWRADAQGLPRHDSPLVVELRITPAGQPALGVQAGQSLAAKQVTYRYYWLPGGEKATASTLAGRKPLVELSQIFSRP